MKKVLIITYYWPPAGGAGVQRALKFVKYLPQFGWEPIVLTVENPDSPVDDLSLFKDIPEGTKVYRTKSLEPFELYKKFTGKQSDSKIPIDILISKDNASLKEKIANWIRLNVFIPDAKIGWKRYAVKKGLEIIANENIDLIFTTSPPQTVSLIGKTLSKRSGVKWIADFRDPWMEIVYYQNVKRNWLTTKIDTSLEKKVFSKANGVVTISNDMIRLFKAKVESQKFYLIPNGFDETDFSNPSKVKNDNFTIAYTGSISKDRVPSVLFSALDKLINSDGIKNIRLSFAGRYCSEFMTGIEKYNLSGIADLRGFVPHSESTQILQNADALLLVVDDVKDNKGFLTGKLFEYMGSKQPIFAIGPIDGDAHEFIKQSNSGAMVDYRDEEGAYNLLKEMYENWKTNSSSYTFEAEQFSRKNLTEKLAAAFEKVLK
ncbi:MAG: glycosyltransferase family 4 protein [Melioribacteraceae bacterium]|jgi:glycosyltransferase involved in cell wall biosynthesis|nr:glycosyltransferase family 4 protein [Melioribacteraceae bacterium]